MSALNTAGDLNWINLFHIMKLCFKKVMFITIWHFLSSINLIKNLLKFVFMNFYVDLIKNHAINFIY
jgi:hypothetical protein